MLPIHTAQSLMFILHSPGFELTTFAPMAHCDPAEIRSYELVRIMRGLHTFIMTNNDGLPAEQPSPEEIMNEFSLFG